MEYVGKLTRVEQALQLWEDMCFVRRINRIHARTQKQDPDEEYGKIIPGDDLRNYLLTSYGKPFDAEKFIDLNPKHRLQFGCVRYLPLVLHSWTNQSRRVYHMTSEIQALLEATSLDGVTWNDVYWPFNSFVITLENPLIDDQGLTYDCLIVAKTDYEAATKYGSITILGLCTDLGKYQPVLKIDKPLVIRAAKKNSHESKAAQRFDRWDYRRVRMHLGFDVLLNIQDPDAELIGTFKEYDKLVKNVALIEERKIATRLIIGLCMLMRTKRADRYIFRHEAARPRPIRNNHAAVTSQYDLFLISGEHMMNRESREIVRMMGQNHSLKKVKAYWHPGYWRRPRGKGNDPAWPKTEWVNPYPVNGFKLPEGAVPLATRTILA